MKQPFFSIIVPVYNAKQYLDECIGSVLNQTFDNWEMLIIDDGSTDGSDKLCDSYAEAHDNITVVHKENGGLSSARNCGIQKATGEYLLLLDSDDALKGNDALEQIESAVREALPDLFCFLPVEYDAELKETVIVHPRGSWEENTVHRGRDFIDSLYQTNGIWVTKAQTKMIRRSFCTEHELFFYEGIYHEDDEWLARVFLSEPAVMLSYGTFYAYRHTAGSIIRTKDTEKIMKKKRDRVIVAYEMLMNPNAKHYPHFVGYASNYLIINIFSVGKIEQADKDAFLTYIKPYEKCYKKMLYARDPKTVSKALMLMLMGTKRFMAFYERKNNA